MIIPLIIGLVVIGGIAGIVAFSFLKAELIKAHNEYYYIDD